MFGSPLHEQDRLAWPLLRRGQSQHKGLELLVTPDHACYANNHQSFSRAGSTLRNGARGQRVLWRRHDVRGASARREHSAGGQGRRDGWDALSAAATRPMRHASSSARAVRSPASNNLRPATQGDGLEEVRLARPVRRWSQSKGARRGSRSAFFLHSGHRGCPVPIMRLRACFGASPTFPMVFRASALPVPCGRVADAPASGAGSLNGSGGSSPLFGTPSGARIWIDPDPCPAPCADRVFCNPPHSRLFCKEWGKRRTVAEQRVLAFAARTKGSPGLPVKQPERFLVQARQATRLGPHPMHSDIDGKRWNKVMRDKIDAKPACGASAGRVYQPGMKDARYCPCYNKSALWLNHRYHDAILPYL